MADKKNEEFLQKLKEYEEEYMKHYAAPEDEKDILANFARVENYFKDKIKQNGAVTERDVQELYDYLEPGNNLSSEDKNNFIEPYMNIFISIWSEAKSSKKPLDMPDTEVIELFKDLIYEGLENTGNEAAKMYEDKIIEFVENPLILLEKKREFKLNSKFQKKGAEGLEDIDPNEYFLSVVSDSTLKDLKYLLTEQDVSKKNKRDIAEFGIKGFFQGVREQFEKEGYEFPQREGRGR